MNDEVVDRLSELVAQEGVDLSSNPRRLRGLLSDLCPNDRLEVSVLVSALEDGVPEALRSPSHGSSPEAVVDRLSRGVQDNRGLAPDVARWAVLAWATALAAVAPDSSASAVSAFSTTRPAADAAAAIAETDVPTTPAVGAASLPPERRRRIPRAVYFSLGGAAAAIALVVALVVAVLPNDNTSHIATGAASTNGGVDVTSTTTTTTVPVTTTAPPITTVAAAPAPAPKPTSPPRTAPRRTVDTAPAAKPTSGTPDGNTNPAVPGSGGGGSSTGGGPAVGTAYTVSEQGAGFQFVSGDSGTWHDTSDAGSYGGHSFWTLTTPSNGDACGASIHNSARWSEGLPTPGSYTVWVWIPALGANTTNARYLVFYDGGSTVIAINQNSYTSRWVSLGTYRMSGAKLELNDITFDDCSAKKGVAFDEASWVYQGS